MSEWSEGVIVNKNSLVLWGSVTVIAFMRYLYDSRCGERRGLVGPVDPEESEVQSRNRAAEEKLINVLDETTRPFKKATLPEGEIADDDVAVGDIEEGTASSGDSDENEVKAISNACAICLEEFEEGDMIVSSVTTKGCPHIFHVPCLKEVITATTNKGIYSIPCPCCRQKFVETGSEVSA